MKKNLQLDRENYDYMYATVKKSKLDELTAHYKALGWEIISRDDDRQYADIIHFTLRRAHVIKHKDELQLLQVYLETAWNTIGKLEANPCPKTMIVGLTLGIIGLAFIIIGLCALLYATVELFNMLGIMWIVAGGLFLVLCMILAVELYKREKVQAAKDIKEARIEIEKVYAEAERLGRSEDEQS